MAKVLFILCAFFIFVIPTFGQEDVSSLFDTSRRSEYSGNYQRAIAQINKAIDIEPANPDLYLRRAHLYAELKDKDATLENVQIVFALKPDDHDYLEKCVRELNLSGSHEESFKIAERLISSKNKWISNFGYKIRYLTRFSLKDYAGTIQDIIKTDSLYRAYEERIVINYSDKSQTKVLIETLLFKTLSGLEENPNVFDYYDSLFRILNKKVSFSSSLSMNFYIKVELYAGYARAYEKQRTPAEASALFDKYTKDLGLGTRAEIYLNMERYELAVKDLTELLKSSSDTEDYLRRRGDIYMLMNQFDKALADYESAKKLYKDRDYMDERISEAKRRLNEVENQQ